MNSAPEPSGDAPEPQWPSVAAPRLDDKESATESLPANAGGQPACEPSPEVLLEVLVAEIGDPEAARAVLEALRAAGLVVLYDWQVKR